MIHLTNIKLQHGSQIIFHNASLQILPNTRTGLVGPNGSGKTTVFRIIIGEEIPIKEMYPAPVKQLLDIFLKMLERCPGERCSQEVMSAAGDIVELAEQIAKMEAAMAEPMEDGAMADLLEKYGQHVEIFEQRGGYDLEPRAQAILTGLGIDPADFSTPVENFSGGLEDADSPCKNSYH